MKVILYLSGFIYLSLFFTACSTSEESTKQKTDTGEYVFDEVPDNDIITIDTPETKDIDLLYVIQIGAFTTEEKANSFAEQSRNKIGKKLKVSYSQKVNLFVVYVDPPFESKAEAESVRNNLWNMDGFQDAWIVTIKPKK